MGQAISEGKLANGKRRDVSESGGIYRATDFGVVTNYQTSRTARKLQEAVIQHNIHQWLVLKAFNYGFCPNSISGRRDSYKAMSHNLALLTTSSASSWNS